MIPNDWRRYYTGEPALLRNRRQSAAFIRAYGLVPLPLQAHSKAAIVGPPPPFPEWLDLDHPDPRNWSVAIPKPTPIQVWADIDTDTRTLSSATPWTEELLAEAQHYQRIVSDAFDAFGVSCHRFGRDSLDNLGHAILPISLDAPGLRQPPLDLIDMLNMKRKVRIGNLMVGIEMRRASEKPRAVPKSITLPGSTYPGLTQPLDLIRWREEADFPEGSTWDRQLAPQPLHALRLALYAALLTLGVVNLWAQGDRHAMALIVAGALAHESGNGFLGNETANPDDAAKVFDFVLTQTGDPEAKDRRKVFADTMTAFAAGKPVTGYKTLRENIGDDIGKALLAMRGGSNPDAINDMFANAVYIEKDDRWLWLPEGSHTPLFLRTNAEMQRFLRHHPDYPPVPRTGKAGNIQVIDIVLNSDRKQRVINTVSFPGIDYGTRYIREDDEYVALDAEDQIARIERGEPPRRADAINVSAGFVVQPLPEGETPDQHVWERVLFLWKRHRAWLTQDIPIQNEQLDQLIARKIQYPRRKYPLGCALVGGQGIGKSALFFAILDRVIGQELIGHSSRAEMQIDFRYHNLDKVLFYVIEELRLHTANSTIQESFKDLMRNKHIPRNRKYSTQDTCLNVAIPIITSNEKNPTILVDGIPDRALLVIRGHSQATLGCTAEAWAQVKATVRDEVNEFMDALKDPAIRQAMFHYWDNLEINETIFDTVEMESVSTDDVIQTLSWVEQSLIEMLTENGSIFPGQPTGPSLHEPFLFDTVIDGIFHRTGRRTTRSVLGQAWASLFMDSKFKKGDTPNNKLNRDSREKMVRSKQWVSADRQRRRSYYFSKGPQDIIDWLRVYRNIDIEFEIDLYPTAKFGEIPEPDQLTLQRALDKRENVMRFPRSLGTP